MTKNIFFISLKYIIFNLIGDIIFFLPWWYTQGAKKTIFFCWRKIKRGEKILGLRVWAVNLFHPMYGMRDIASRIISFVLRLVQIIVRTFLLLLWIIFLILLFLIYLILPPFIIYQIIQQIIILV